VLNDKTKTVSLPISASQNPQGEARFYELDILRGIAALIVVSYHYKHFFLVSDQIGFAYPFLPFHVVFLPVYIFGQFFVELFFSISGYVFFWLYSESISRRTTGAAEFFIARFARLYPLYVATLLFVAIGQWAFRDLYHHDFIYQQNTLANFLLNLFMVHQWVPNAIQSYNGPSWSISVEVFLYLAFFTLCFFRLNTPLVVTFLFVVGLGLRYALPGPNDFIRGLPSFFVGAMVFYAVRLLKQPDMIVWYRRTLGFLCVILPIAWITTYFRGREMPAVLPDNDLLSRVLGMGSFLYILLPLTLLLLGLMQSRWPVKWLDTSHLHKVSWIGDISYSLYLIHFPLQLIIMLVLSHWSFESRVAVLGTPLAFVGFMSLACGLAWLSFHYFEMPSRRLLKPWLSRHLPGVMPANRL